MFTAHDPRSTNFGTNIVVPQPESPLMWSLVRILLVLFTCTTFSAFAAELGVVGPTYEIAEPDLIEVIQARLTQLGLEIGEPTFGFD